MPDLASLHHLGPFLSSLLVHGVGTLGFGGLAFLAFRESKRKHAEARSADDYAALAAVTLAERSAGDTVLYGTVEFAQDTKTAVRVEINQYGEESESSGTWSHKWTEKNRVVVVAPFYLRLSSGERVRVEPTSDVFLIDSMDGFIRVDLMQRTRYAELTPGERVYAAGTLSRAPDPESSPAGDYRAGREGFVLRPPRGRKMLLSSEPLGARFRERALFHSSWGYAIVVIALFFQCTLLGYQARRFAGTTTTATISKLTHDVSKDNEGDEVHEYTVWLKPADGGPPVSDEVDFRLFNTLHEGDKVPMRLVRGALSNSSTIGPDSTAPFAAWCVVPLLGLFWFFYRAREKSTRPWYERTIVDTGSGRLAETL